MKLNRRKFLGILGVAPVVGAVVATVKAEPEPTQLAALSEPRFPNPYDLMIGRDAYGSFAIDGDGKQYRSPDGVTWTEKRRVSFNDFDIVPPRLPFPSRR